MSNRITNLTEQGTDKGFIFFFALCPYCDKVFELGGDVPDKIFCPGCRRQGVKEIFKVFALCLVEVYS